MIIDGRQLAPGVTLQADICIVGTGAAGMTLAHDLLRSGMRVLVLEAGGSHFTRKAQEAYKGEVANPAHHGALDHYRHRRLGGTTAVWGGRVAPFTPVDFARREHVPHSGWPVSLSELQPFYVRANEYCEAGECVYDAREALPCAPELLPGFHSDDVDVNGIWRFSPPTDFGRTYREAVAASPNVTLVLHANCLRLQCRPDGTSVDRIEAASSPTRGFHVAARRFVLACGGLETTRLLLLSNDVHTDGIGNGYGLLGRFYMSHMTGDGGEVEIHANGAAVWNYERTSEGVYCRRALTISASAQRREGLLNFRAIFSHALPADPRHGCGVLSAMYLVKRLLARRIPPEYSRSLSAMRPLEHVAAHCRNVAFDSPSLARFSAVWTRRRLLARRKLPSVALPNRAGVYTLHYDAEQRPNRESRVTLCDARDEFGLARLRVDWRFTPEDVSSVAGSCRLIGDELARTGAGRLKFHPAEIAEQIFENSAVGSHHIGTTRMAATPRDGVVDPNCRVHDVENLFIASSSVFPTSGFANPTLTIVALALRLADHLRTSASPLRDAAEAGAVYAR